MVTKLNFNTRALPVFISILVTLISFYSFQIISAQPGIFPSRIMLTIPDDPATSRAVSWRTSFEVTVAKAELNLANVAPDLETGKVTIAGNSNPWEEGSESGMGHKVIFENLKPDTKYTYRVGNGNIWSEWLQFKTSSNEAKPFSFLYFGDIQNGIKSHGSRVLRQAYSNFPDSHFMIFGGDLTSNSTEEEWRNFFYAGGWIHGMVPSMPTPGSHAYERQNDDSFIFSRQWNQIFSLPLNGPAGMSPNRHYYIDYQGVRFISIDSQALLLGIDNSSLLMAWLNQVLTDNPNTWTVVFQHHPVYACSGNRTTNQDYTTAMRDMYEKHGVDIVLQGHDHAYCRGQNLSEAGEDVLNYPMYVVSVAGAKMDESDPDTWSDIHASDIQLYQHININGNTLFYKSFTAEGELFDSFQLVKNEEGVNEVVDCRIDDKWFQDIENVLQGTTVNNYQKIEISFDDFSRAKNKFNTDEITIEAVFTSPSGIDYLVPAFWYQDYKVSSTNIIENGKPHWRLRFTPRETGEWKGVIRVNIHCDQFESDLGEFQVLEATKASRGFLRISTDNQYSLEFENGDPLFTIGYNIDERFYAPGKPLTPWMVDRSIELMEKLSDAGGTFVRFRMDSWFLPIEGPVDSAPGYKGIGDYNLKAAWMLDKIIEAAEGLGITLMLCMENANGTVNSRVNQIGNRPFYNFYMKERGGPLDDIMDFFTDSQVKKYFQRKISYSVGRWGYSTAIGMWQFFNEVNINQVEGTPSLIWHEEMGEYLKSLDPYNRPVTTSYVSNIFTSEFASNYLTIPGIDVIQKHEYVSTDFTEDWSGFLSWYLQQNPGKPIMIGEFGTSKNFREIIAQNITDSDRQSILLKYPHFPVNHDHETAFYLSDPEGLHIHNASWVSIFSGGTGALSWFSRNIDYVNHYFHYSGISNFIKEWGINQGEWRPVQIELNYTEMVPDIDSELQPSYNILSLGYGGEIRFWIQHEHSNYFKYYEGSPPEHSRTADILVSVPTDATYTVTWWDTFEGEPSGSPAIINSMNGILSIPFDGTLSDIACIIEPL
jgi:hypothetical protein